MSEKKYRLAPSEIQDLAPGLGGCLATDHITVDGHRVGYMYRELPDDPSDSGWRFFSGLESDEYANNAANLAIYDVNTIVNYDPQILPFLNAPTGTAFARDGRSGEFIEEELTPQEE